MDILSYLLGFESGKSAGGGGGSGGGGSLPAGLYLEALAIPPARGSNYGQSWYEWNGELYAFVNSATGSAGINRVYRWDDSAWTQVHQASSDTYISGGSARIIEFNGVLHLFQGVYHATFDGTTLQRKTNAPQSFETTMVFTQNGKLKGCYYSNGNVYVWNEADDTWSQEGSTGKTGKRGFYEVNGAVYVPDNTTLYTYSNGVLTTLATDVSVGNKWYVLGGRVFTLVNSGSYIQYLAEIDMNTYQSTILGVIPYRGNQDVIEYDGGLAAVVSSQGSQGIAWLAKICEVTE